MARTAVGDVTTPALYLALELSKATWKLGFATHRTQRPRIRDVPAGDQAALLAEVAAAKAKLGLAPETPVRSCYEAGRDGFWIHRFLEANGVENVIVDPASIEVDRRARRAKTDRIDVQKLVSLLIRHHEGERVLRVAKVPSVEVEDERLFTRQVHSLKSTRVSLANAIRGALICHGVDLDPCRVEFRASLARARQWDGSPLPPELCRWIDRQWELLEVVLRQLNELRTEENRRLRAAARGDAQATTIQRKAAVLAQLHGIGNRGAHVLSAEFFAWRDFKNRKQVAALAGLAGTPFSSGAGSRDQGISKAGNARVRSLMVELAWCWLRFQPQSQTSRWFHEHVGKGGKRNRRKAIVAVARKLLIELWHFVDHGVIPAGAVLSAARAKQTA